MGFVLVGTDFTQPDYLIKLEVPTMMEVDPLPSPMMPVLICLFCCQEMTMRICDRVKHFVLPDWHATNRAGLAHDNFNRRQWDFNGTSISIWIRLEMRKLMRLNFFLFIALDTVKNWSGNSLVADVFTWKIDFAQHTDLFQNEIYGISMFTITKIWRLSRFVWLTFFCK